MSGLKTVITGVIAFFTTLYMAVSTLLFSPVVHPPIEEKAQDDIRILSFNIRCANVGIHQWDDRIGAVTGAIRAIAPDSFGVQEATPQWMEALREELPEYADVGVGRDDGANRGEFSAIFYLKDRYEGLDYGTFWLSETPDEPSSGWDASCKRICTWIVLRNKESGAQYAHLNTHFDHLGIKARKNSADMILAKAAEFDLPAVCTGDFNAVEFSSAYNRLVGGQLKNAKYSAPDTMSAPTFNNGYNIKRFGAIYDHILINDGFEARVYRVVTEKFDGMLPSDHYPVYTDLSLVS